MAFSTLRMAAVSPLQFSGLKPSDSQLKPKKIPQLQVRCKGDSEAETPKRLSISRRDAMICLTTFCVTSLGVSSSPETAQAVMKKDEMRRKIKEKLEKMREKAGLSKQKEKNHDKSSSTPPSAEENILLMDPIFPLPTPPQGLKKSLVETTFL